MIDLVRLTGAAVVFPEYGLSPETKFPGAIEQCYAVATWIVENSASLALDASRFAIAGDSAGGGLAAVVAMLAGQRGGPAFRTQMLFYPVVDCDFNTASYLEFGTGFNLDTPVMEWFWAHYIPEDAKRIEPFASPLRSSLEELQLAPPALVLTAECDVLRDEGEAYARKLADAGVQTAGYRCLGTVHSFLLANGLAESATARVAMQLVAAHLRAAFA
jgi:acetyl esterase